MTARPERRNRTDMELVYMVGRPKAVEPWSLTSLHEKLIKIDVKVFSRGRYVTFQIAEVAVAADVRGNPVADCPAASTATAGVRRGVKCDGRRQQKCTAQGGAILVPQAPGSRGLSVQIFRLRFGYP